MESRARRTGTRAGYTLVELMVAVTILGILAAIAIPMFKGYIYRSKANEASGFLMEIKNRQESYRSLYRQYFDVSQTFDNWYPSSTPGSTTQTWPNETRWNALGAQPPGRQVYFSYVTIAGGPGTDPSGAGAPTTMGYDGTDFWFVARALGNLDGDDEYLTFESYSASQNVWCSHTSGWE